MKYIKSALVIIMIVGLAFAIPTTAGEKGAYFSRIVSLDPGLNCSWAQDANAYAQITFKDWSNWSTPNEPEELSVGIDIKVRNLYKNGNVSDDQNAYWAAHGTYVLNIYAADNKTPKRIFTFNTGKNSSYGAEVWFFNSPITMPFDLVNDELYIEIVSNDDDGLDPCGWCEVNNPEDLPEWVVLFAHVPATE